MNLNLTTIPSKEIMPGYHGKMVHATQMSVAFWEVEKGAKVPQHAHIHEQIMHVVEGEFEFTLNGETKIYLTGDIVIIPPNVPHSGKALTVCKLIDVFSPVREEYR
ncbi:cupin domain-containing protein [Arenibacter sp. GZD96]|uniref:cupin domain-containing protein n=1 Tax=Aurantibrevibacter litoralis TaxID=3106030 RepID=UPI002AFF0B0B|nr:cupin domain-containing protein [Arenibacter sp. GZD-96]MEA1785911.1 cupin domain-containing protein [Arenibacter sp. GZD-96]